ncbi:MAG: hypothetical protein GKR89_19770 [Candidatus Latescibacteria bacterium]|nr:hypothetical protein [Candidatus Latescibacterota bacterium]
MNSIAFLSTAHIHTKGFLDAIAQRDDCQVAALWDDTAARGQRYADQYDTQWTDDLAGLVGRDDVDGFIVCAENARHLPLLEAAIPTGKPVFCEKPFTTTVADARRAVELIGAHGTIVHMGYFQPFAADMQGIAAVIDSGVLGKITHARYRNAHHAAYGRWFDSDDLAWFADPDLAGGGAFMDMGTHAVHLLRTLLGPVQEAAAVISNVSGIYETVDDNGTAWLRFADGALGTVEASWVQTGGLGGLEITGSKGTLFNDPQQGYVVAAPGEEAVPVAPGQDQPTRVDRLVAAIEGRLGADEFGRDLQCAVDAVAIMEACYRSNRDGGWAGVEAIGAA